MSANSSTSRTTYGIGSHRPSYLMYLFGAGDRLAVGASSAGTGGRFLLLAGEPIGETVARHGPFVMNTQEELVAAIEDYRAGRMGVIERN